MMAGQQFQKREYKPKILTESEVAKLPESEKMMLMMQPTEEGSMWKTVPEKNYHKAMESDVLTGCVNFYQMLVSEAEHGFSHLVFGGMQFSKGSGHIYRSEHRERNKPAAGGGGSRFKPRYLAELYMGNLNELNEKVKDGDWQLAYPSVTIGDKILIVKYKQ